MTKHLNTHIARGETLTRKPGKHDCPKCGRGCGNEGGLAHHINKMHRVNLQTSADPPIVYPCDKCITICKSYRGLTAHKDWAHLVNGVALDDRRLTDPQYLARKYACSECIQRFVSRVNLMDHIRRAHTKLCSDADANTDSTYTCRPSSVIVGGHGIIAGDTCS